MKKQTPKDILDIIVIITYIAIIYYGAYVLKIVPFTRLMVLTTISYILALYIIYKVKKNKG